jgi:hypothetical protein
MTSPAIIPLFEEPGLFALSIIRSSTTTIPATGKSNQIIGSILCILIHHAITKSLLMPYNELVQRHSMQQSKNNKLILSSSCSRCPDLCMCNNAIRAEGDGGLRIDTSQWVQDRTTMMPRSAIIYVIHFSIDHLISQTSSPSERVCSL